MDWTHPFFIHKAQIWVNHMKAAEMTLNTMRAATPIMAMADILELEGCKCYAARQAHVYHQLAEHAQSLFQKVRIVRPASPPSQ